MRSVFAYLRDAEEAEVAAWLDTVARSGGEYGPPWNFPRSGPAALVISLGYNPDELEPDETERLRAALDGPPRSAVQIDVVGGVDGTAEVTAFLGALLARFGGVAHDDIAEHFWTRSEIESGAQHDGLGFFDYARAYTRARLARPLRDARDSDG